MTALAIQMPDLGPADTVAQQATASAQKLSAEMCAVVVSTPEQAQWAVNAAHQLRKHKRALEAERDGVAKPLRQLATQHSKRWKPAIDALDVAERHLKGQAVAFQAAERQRQAEALKAATNPAEVAQAVAVVAPAPTGLQERESWSWAMVDETKVPRDYFVLDTARLDREARQQKGALAVPGIKPVRKVTGVLR